MHLAVHPTMLKDTFSVEAFFEIANSLSMKFGRLFSLQYDYKKKCRASDQFDSIEIFLISIFTVYSKQTNLLNQTVSKYSLSNLHTQ